MNCDWGDKEYVKQRVQQNGMALQFAHFDLKKDKEIVKVAVRQDAKALQYAHFDLKRDKEIVKVAMQQDGVVLKYADESLKNNGAFLCDLFFDQESLPSKARNVLNADVANEVDSFLNTHHTIEVIGTEKIVESSPVLKLQENQIQFRQSDSAALNKNISLYKTLIQSLQKENAQLKKQIGDLPLQGFLTKNEEKVRRISNDYKFDFFKISQSSSECQQKFQFLTKLSKGIEEQMSKLNAAAAGDDDDDDMVLSTTESGEDREISDDTVRRMKKSEILVLCEKRDKDRVELKTKLDELLTVIEQEDDLICKIQYAQVFDKSVTLELLNSYSKMRECLSELKCEVNKNLALLPKLELKEQLRKEIKEKFIEPHRKKRKQN